MASLPIQAQGDATATPTITPSSTVTFTPSPTPTQAAPAPVSNFGQLVQNCGSGETARGPDFAATGYILTTFSRDALWVVELERVARYPLPETRPCGPNCVASPDRTRLLYVAAETATFHTMLVDGTGRQQVYPFFVSAMEWWDDRTWLVWPPVGAPYLLAMDGETVVRRLPDYDVFSVQPGGYYGLRLVPGDGEYPVLELVNLETGGAQPLVHARQYFGGGYWSPDGSRLAFIGAGERDESLDQYGAELYAIRPGEDATQRLTNLTAAYGAVRIAGPQESTALSWSPDGSRIAFWVQEIIGPDEFANVGQAVLHVLDTASGLTTVYCGFGVNLTRPNPPALVWSPDGRYIAFGVDVPADERPALLLALDTERGDYTEITEGMYAAYGTVDPVMWGAR